MKAVNYRVTIKNRNSAGKVSEYICYAYKYESNSFTSSAYMAPNFQDGYNRTTPIYTFYSYLISSNLVVPAKDVLKIEEVITIPQSYQYRTIYEAPTQEVARHNSPDCQDGCIGRIEAEGKDIGGGISRAEVGQCNCTCHYRFCETCATAIRLNSPKC